MFIKQLCVSVSVLADTSILNNLVVKKKEKKIEENTNRPDTTKLKYKQKLEENVIYHFE